MMLVWLAYCTVMGAAIAVAASMAQRAALLLRWRLRHLWLGAMLLTAGVSIGSLVTAARSPSNASAAVHANTAFTGGVPVAVAPLEGSTVPALSMALRLFMERVVERRDALAARLSRFDAYVVAGWILLSAMLAALVLREAWASRRLRRACEARHINGTHVLLTENLGPAAIGLGASSVLLPRWALELENHLLELVLRHEREHLKAKDPLLLLVGLAVLVLFPWQLALWWMWQRLRLAIEVDCDGRLLADGRLTARYAQLLLLLSQRLGRPAPALRPFITVAAPLHPAQSHLATRIRIMTQEHRGHAPLKIGLAVTGVLCAAAFAYAMPVPHATAGRKAPAGSAPAATALPAPSSKAAAVATEPQQDTAKVYLEHQVTEPVKLLPGTAVPIYPAAEKAALKEAEVLAQYIVNAIGRPEVASLKFLRGTIIQADGKKVSVPKPESEYTPFEIAVRDALPYMRFAPAKLNGVAVRQLVQHPFVFAIAK